MGIYLKMTSWGVTLETTIVAKGLMPEMAAGVSGIITDMISEIHTENFIFQFLHTS